MTQTPALSAPQRLVSLDAFRGITIAGMILVNNPGSWGHIYGPLGHATWNGWTPTDLVFPFFLFIVGVAMTFSFQRRAAQGGRQTAVLPQVIRRTVILFMLGLIMAGYPDFRLIGPYILVIVGLALLFAQQPLFGGGPPGVTVQKVAAGIVLVGALAYFVVDFGHFQESHLRVPGVLQRIALCYFFASLIMMSCGVGGRIVWTVLLIVGYWIIVKCVAAPSGYTATLEGPGGLLHDWIDVKLLGAHLYSHRPDPEGLLSTLPAIATALLGVLTGHWLQSNRERSEKAIGLFFAANVALIAGMCMDYGFPINKKIWSSSYVVLMAGLSLHFLAMCYWLIDIRGYRRWAWPFIVFGSNAIVVYVASSLGAKTLGRIKLATADGGEIRLNAWIYQHVFASWAGELNGSLFYALSYVALWLIVLIPLYRKRLFVKI
jgi:predicted acyltransferase